MTMMDGQALGSIHICLLVYVDIGLILPPEKTIKVKFDTGHTVIDHPVKEVVYRMRAATTITDLDIIANLVHPLDLAINTNTNTIVIIQTVEAGVDGNIEESVSQQSRQLR